jgi:hypothetical protein
MTDTPSPGSLADRLKPTAVVDGTDTEDVEIEVEEALGRLEALPELPVTDHVQVFEGVQQRLAEILSNVDDA